MSSVELWMLFDPEKNLKTQVMSTEDMQFSLLKLKTRHIERFLIWSNRDENWSNLRTFLDSDKSPFMKTFLLIGKNRKKENESDEHTVKMEEVTEADKKDIMNSYSQIELEERSVSEMTRTGVSQFDGDSLAEKKPENINIDFKNLNQKQKEQFKIEALLSTKKGHLFKTTLTNINLGGAFTQQAIPAPFQDVDFDVLIINNFIPDQHLSRVKVKGKIHQTDTSQYVQFSFEKPEAKQNLKSILSFYLKKMNELNLKAA